MSSKATVRTNSLDAQKHLQRAAELIRRPAAGPADLPAVVELLACCNSQREKAAVCLVKYRGLSLAKAGKILQMTSNEVSEQIQGVACRRDAAIQCVKAGRGDPAGGSGGRVHAWQGPGDDAIANWRGFPMTMAGQRPARAVERRIATPLALGGCAVSGGQVQVKEPADGSLVEGSKTP